MARCQSRGGRDKAAARDAKEMIRLAAKIASQTRRVKKAVEGERPIKTPILVATPLPPLNFKKTEKVWPIIAARLTAIIQLDGKRKIWRARIMGRKPLAASNNRVAAAGPLPITRRILAAPMLPLPFVRISTPQDRPIK